MAFDALEVSIQLNREVSEICGKLKKRSATLAKQLRARDDERGAQRCGRLRDAREATSGTSTELRTGARRKCTRFCGWRWRRST